MPAVIEKNATQETAERDIVPAAQAQRRRMGRFSLSQVNDLCVHR